MNTMSNTAMMRAIFKRAQVLPLLTPAMTAGRGRAATPYVVQPRTEAQPARSDTVPAAANTRLPAPLTAESAVERIYFGLLALSAAAGIEQMFAPMIGFSTNWPRLEATVAWVLG